MTNGSTGNVWCPISTATGELFGFDERPDLALGGPLPLTFRRYYAAYLVANGVTSSLGNNWMHNFDLKLAVSGSAATVTLFGGKTVQFTKSGTAWQLSSTERRPYQLVASGSSYRFLSPPTNLIYTLDSTGALSRVEDREGNALTVTQAAGGIGPATVSDGLGRTLTFSYTGATLTRVQDQAGRVVSFQSSNGNLASSTDANGNTATYAYTSAGGMNGLMTAETKPAGNKPFTQTFDTQGRVATQADSFANAMSLAYSSATNGATMTEPLGVSFTHAHDAQRDLTLQSDPSGASTQRTYDANLRPTGVTDRLGNKSSETWDPASGLPAAFIDAAGNVTRYTYAATTSGGFVFYDLAGVQFADGTSVSFTRDANGNPLSLTDQAGKQWQATYNTRGQPATLTNPSGAVTTFAYGNDGTLASVKTDSGDTTQIGYDASSRPNQFTFPDNNKRQFQYDPASNLLRFTDERNNSTNTAYDVNYNSKSVTDALSAVTAFGYDTDDRQVAYTDALGKATTTTYDAVNRVHTVANAAGNSVTYGYDTLNRATSAVDAAGKGNTYGWDKESRLTSLTDALGRVAKVTRDALGRTTGFTTPNNETYSATYDKLGRRTSATNPLGESRQAGYDARGLLQSVTLSAGIAGSLARNELGLIAGVTDPNGNTWPNTFDKMGRLATLTDPLGQATSFQWDSRQRLAGITLPSNPLAANPVAQNVQFSYDAANNLTGHTYSDGTKLSYSYDSDNRLTSGSGLTLGYDAAGRLTQSNGLGITRDAAGRIASITYATGKTVTYTYSARGFLTTVTDWVGGTTTLTYDDAGQVTSVTYPNGVREDYTYDADGRVATIKASLNGTVLASIALQRDAAGKVTSAVRSAPQVPDVPTSAFSMAYDAAHQSFNQTYDPLGRVTSNPALAYTWDLASRLASLSGPAGAVTFTYDALGQRISRTSGGTAQNYALNYALRRPSVSVIQASGIDQRYYIWLPNGMLLESIEAAGNARHFFHFDEAGSAMFLSNDSGAVTDTYAMTPYGEVIASTGTTPNPFTFKGRSGVMQEGTTGLYYMRARYYDSTLARFVSRDPVASLDPMQMNPYQYAKDSPLRFGDPTGLQFDDDESSPPSEEEIGSWVEMMCELFGIEDDESPTVSEEEIPDWLNDIIWEATGRDARKEMRKTLHRGRVDRKFDLKGYLMQEKLEELLAGPQTGDPIATSGTLWFPSSLGNTTTDAFGSKLYFRCSSLRKTCVDFWANRYWTPPGSAAFSTSPWNGPTTTGSLPITPDNGLSTSDYVGWWRIMPVGREPIR
jgi:RHS repeat-associated protein